MLALLCLFAVFLLGFSTYAGTVTAADDWGAPAQRKRVRPGLPNSWEELFHATGIPRFWLDLRGKDAAAMDVVDAAIAKFLQRPLPQEKKAVLVGAIGDRPFRVGTNQSDRRVAQMIGLLMSTPEYQMQ